MKKIFLLLLIFISIKVFGQFTQPQNFGSKTTLVQNKGGFVSDSALILPHFTDTTRANLGPAPKFYPGNLIRTVDDTLWFRDNTATKWIKVGGATATTITADNGLTMSTATNVQLGGTLLFDTEVGNSIFNLQISAQEITPLKVVRSDALATGTVNVLSLYRDGANGTTNTGINQDFYLKNNVGSFIIIGQHDFHFSSATSGSETSYYSLNLVNNGFSANVFNAFGDGYIQIPGYGAGTKTGVATYGLAVDVNGNIIEGAAGGGISGITADNGLTANTSTNVRLGGTLLQNTTITNAGFGLTVTNNTGQNTFIGVNSSTGIAIYGSASSGIGIQGESNSNYGIFGFSASGIASLFNINPSSTNTIANIMLLQRNTTGTGANGIGGSIEFNIETSVQAQLANQLISKWTDATDATRTSQFLITGVDNAVTQDLLTLAGSGAAKLNQYGAGTFSGTAAFTLAVDASGNVIEVTGGGGGISSLTSVGGGLDIQSGGAGNINTLNASDFNLASNLISIDYTNGQAASGSNKGFLTSADWTIFNNKANAALDNLASVAINTSLLPATDDAIDLGSATKQWRDLYMTGASIYMAGVKTLSSAGLDLPTGGGIRTRTSAGNTVLLQAYDVDGTAYVTFGTLTANNTPTFNLSTAVTVGGDPILTTVAAAAAYQPLDADLTTIAGLTATTDNFIVSVSSAWASRTPSQVRTTLGLVIGTDVQAFDADLTTWAGITPGSNVGTFLGTPSSANLRAAVTDENGTGVLLFNAATTPSFTTGIQIGGAAASRKILVGDGTNFVPSTETWAVPGTSGNVLTSDGTNWTSSPTVKYAAASAGTTTSNSLTDLTGMSIALTAGTWVFDIWIYGQAGTGTAGAQFGVNYTGTTTSIEANCAGQLSTTTFAATTRITAINTASVVVFTTSAAEGWVHISGKIVVSDAGDLRARGLKVTSQTLTWRASSWMKAYKVA